MTIRRRSEQPVLRLTGLVEEECSLDWQEVGRLPDGIDDLGELAEGLVGEAIPVARLVERARPLPAASYVTAESDDGFYRASIPLEEVTRKGWMAFRLEGYPLPRSRGGPFRLVVPEGETLCWNVKGVRELRFTAEREPDSVPPEPPH